MTDIIKMLHQNIYELLAAPLGMSPIELIDSLNSTNKESLELKTSFETLVSSFTQDQLEQWRKVDKSITPQALDNAVEFILQSYQNLLDPDTRAEITTEKYTLTKNDEEQDVDFIKLSASKQIEVLRNDIADGLDKIAYDFSQVIAYTGVVFYPDAIKEEIYFFSSYNNDKTLNYLKDAFANLRNNFGQDIGFELQLSETPDYLLSQHDKTLKSSGLKMPYLTVKLADLNQEQLDELASLRCIRPCDFEAMGYLPDRERPPVTDSNLIAKLKDQIILNKFNYHYNKSRYLITGKFTNNITDIESAMQIDNEKFKQALDELGAVSISWNRHKESEDKLKGFKRFIDQLDTKIQSARKQDISYFEKHWKDRELLDRYIIDSFNKKRD